MLAGIQNIDVFDLPADALIYSTNVLLNCSGGVGACLVERYGKQVQADLHGLLYDKGVKFAEQGDVFQHVSEGVPYKKVFHTIPCDGFYETTEEIVRGILRRCLAECVNAKDVRSVAFSALATGYGRLGFDSFFRIAAAVFGEEEFSPIETATICIYDSYLYSLAAEQIRTEALDLVCE